MLKTDDDYTHLLSDLKPGKSIKVFIFDLSENQKLINQANNIEIRPGSKSSENSNSKKNVVDQEVNSPVPLYVLAGDNGVKLPNQQKNSLKPSKGQARPENGTRETRPSTADLSGIQMTESTYIDAKEPLLHKIEKVDVAVGEGDILDKVIAEIEKPKSKPSSKAGSPKNSTLENLDKQNPFEEQKLEKKESQKSSQDDVEIVDMDNTDIKSLKEQELEPHNQLHVVRDQVDVVGKGLDNPHQLKPEELLPNMVNPPMQDPQLGDSISSLSRSQGTCFEKAKRIIKKLNAPDLPAAEKERLEHKLMKLKDFLTNEQIEILEEKHKKLEEKAKEYQEHRKKNLTSLVTDFFKGHFGGIYEEVKARFTKKEEKPKKPSFRKLCKDIIQVYDSLPAEKKQEINSTFNGLFEQASTRLKEKEAKYRGCNKPSEENKIKPMEYAEFKPPKEEVIMPGAVDKDEVDRRVEAVKMIFPDDAEDKIRDFVLKNMNVGMDELVENYLMKAAVDK